MLFVAKLFTLLFNKCAKHDADEAVVNDIDNSGEFENPVADESPRGSVKNRVRRCVVSALLLATPRPRVHAVGSPRCHSMIILL